MSEKKIYEIKGFEGTFEFSPNGSPMIGVLSVTHNEQPFSSMVKLMQLGSRAKWAEEAATLYPDIFDAPALKRALNELHILRTEEVEAAKNAGEDVGAEPSEEDQVDDEAAKKLISEPGVLNRYIKDMAAVREVYGDRPQMKAVALGGLSAQLEMLPGDIPLGTNILLAAEAGRGKNYITDAAADGFPDEWVYRFESASAKSFYYETEQDPERFEHMWIYPNEAEATDKLVELLRPVLSGGRAEHKTVNKDADGSNVFREYRVKGPITVTIPTVRNKLDTQLQTRMLVTELEDFEGRVAKHSLKVSDTLLAEYAEKDHGTKLRTWKAAFRKLTDIRRVVIPKRDERFKFNSDEVSHGSRLWRNFASLLLTNAWLEQRNREIRTLANGEQVIVATAEDYRTAYEIFEKACKRSVVNLSKTHRHILDAVYDLQDENDTDDAATGYSYRKIAEQAGCSHQTVKNHKTYLTQSVALLREVEGGGLRLVSEAEPSWWSEGEVLEGFPRPEQVAEWWAEGGSKGPDDPGSGEGGVSSASESGLHGLHSANATQKPDTNGQNPVNPESLQTGLHVNPSEDSGEKGSAESLHVKASSTAEVYSESTTDTPKNPAEDRLSSVSTSFKSGEHTPTTEEKIAEYLDPLPSWFVKQAKHMFEHYPDMPERLLNKLASSVAYDALGDVHKWTVALPIVRTKVEEIKARTAREKM